MSNAASRGQTTPLVAIVLVLAALLLIPLGLIARATIERAEAQNAADAVALAGALEGRAEAETIAARNQGRLESYEQHGDTVEVVVVVGGRRATARAVRSTVRSGPGDR
ncbi:pilus assembly protein TadG-related protein [Actinospongicola halichondriae]|uniref:pilus assembly protein TadG-related protein n=1 Tax=Actinospongicola halichondriae TaxID=3236844 RepID=UPI003D3BBE08